MKQIVYTLIVSTILSCNSGSHQENTSNSTTEISTVKPKELESEQLYKTYCNGRFEYCIDYPSRILFPQPEPTNGDGCAFKNKQAEEILSVAGSYAYEEDGVDPIQSRFELELSGENEENGNKGRVITYQKLGKTFFVVSGYQNGKVFYYKTIIKGNVIASARLQYNESERSIYDKASERIFKSFK